ncbi:MAG TPA: hypothetical protein VMX13_02545 [Sedimentisphaerales bacterium]|nr:hypothetical protein [Sedimentisphaerales bacterium]
MITLMARQKTGKTTLAALFMLLSGLGPCVGVAEESKAEDVNASKVTMVNNVWVDVPLTQVLRDISIETSVVMALCPHVPDPLISIDAGSGKPLQQCLQELVAGRGLFVRPRNERFYLISCGDLMCPSLLEIAEAKRLYLKYITAKHFKSSLPRSVEQYVSSGERPNEVLIYAVPEVMKRVLEIAEELDVPRQQVVLEVLVVELQEEATEEFGIDWEYSNRHTTLSMEHGLGAFTGLARYTSIPANEFTTLLLTLQALVGEQKARIRSRPRVATLNGQEAAIDISLDEYFTVVTDVYGSVGTLRTQLEVIKSGVLLNITPHIGNNGDITVDVLTEVSDVVSRQNKIAGNESGDLPLIRRRKADTTVRVTQGDAIVIGGLIETQERSEDKSVPLLSSIPLVGGIFKTKKSITLQKEVVIFITPRLIDQGDNPFSNSHNIISVEEERQMLSEAPAPLKELLQPARDLSKANIEHEHLHDPDPNR